MNEETDSKKMFMGIEIKYIPCFDGDKKDEWYLVDKEIFNRLADAGMIQDSSTLTAVKAPLKII